MNLSNIKSEIENNKANIKPGMIIWYVDAINTEKFMVTDVTESALTVIDSGGNEYAYEFSGLQFGWQLSDADREMIDLCAPTDPIAEMKGYSQVC